MIYLVRHGQTEWNLAERKQGQSNSSLTDLGKKQARKIAGFLQDELCDMTYKVWASPLSRVKETIAEIDPIIPLSKSVSYRDELKEHSFGEWEGLTEQEIEAQWPGELEKRYADWWPYVVPGGESYELLSKRVEPIVFQALLEKNVIIVAHEMVSKCIRGHLLNLTTEEILELNHPQNIVYKFSVNTLEDCLLSE